MRIPTKLRPNSGLRPVTTLAATLALVLGGWADSALAANPDAGRPQVAAGRAPTAGGHVTTARPHRRTPSAPRRPMVGACVGADDVPNPQNLAAAATATLCMVNHVRARHGLAPLVDDPRLDLAAVYHNVDMIAHDYFAHDSPLGDTLLTRAQAAGYLAGAASTGFALAENLGMATSTGATPRSIVTYWVGSPDVLANIIDPSMRASGLAVTAAAPALPSMPDAAATYTQVFGGLPGA